MIVINTKKPLSLNSKRKNSDSVPPIYKCTRCGKIKSDPKGCFFMSKASPLFVSNEFYSHICSSCIGDLMFEMQSRYKDTKVALMVMCHFLDVYFSEALYEQIKDNAGFSVGYYLKMMNGTQYKAKSFTTSLIEILTKGLRETQNIREEIEEKWNKSDLKNKNYVLQSVGYDCFNDESYTNNNRKFLFNTLADYLTDDVIDDPHKLQCVIGMVKTTLQIENIDRMINQELKRNVTDYVLIDKLSGVKEKLSRNINSTANENGISAKTSGKNSKGTNTLTNIMKEMSENGFDEIKVNIVDAKMSISYQEIAKENAKALMEELNATSDDYAQKLGEQSRLMIELQNETEKKDEEIRLLKIANKKMKENVGDK